MEGGKSGLGDENARVALVDAYYLRCFLSDHFEALVAGYYFRRDIRGDCCSRTSEERFKVAHYVSRSCLSQAGTVAYSYKPIPQSDSKRRKII